MVADRICYLDGAYVPLADARISVLDRSFLFGDGVYEVLPVFDGRAFLIEEHLRRLEDSLAAVDISNPFARSHWRQLIEEVVARNGGGLQTIYLQVSRGAAPRNHVPPPAVAPTVLIMSSPLTDSSGLHQGSAITCEDLRWARCDIKSVALLANVLARREAAERGADEALLVRDGYLTEGATSNVFVVLEGTIATSPNGPQILPGVTRNLLVRLARDGGLPLAERFVTVAELAAASEVWCTSSSRELLAVTSLDGRAVGSGAIGPVTREVHALYRAFRDRSTAMSAASG